MLIVVSAWVTVADRAQLGRLRGAVVSAATYSSNWYLIIENQSYFARFAPPAPLDHLWSLAVEEQFYLVWPWLLLGGLLCVRRLRGQPGGLAWLALPTLALAAGSAVAMLALYHPGLDPTRAYEGTDTRAVGVLIGAALAMIWPSRSAAADGRARTWRRCRRVRRAGRDRRADLAHRPVLSVPLPRRDNRAVGGHDSGRRRRGDPRHPDRPGPGLGPAALGGRPLLRDLPVALSRHRADHRGLRHRGPHPRRRPDRRHRRARRPVLALHRGAHPPGRPDPVLGVAWAGTGSPGPPGPLPWLPSRPAPGCCSRPAPA